MERREFLKSLISLPVALGLAANGDKDRQPSMLLLESAVAGFQYYDGEGIWQRISVNDPLVLTREPSNPHDLNAVEVYWKTAKLGYLPRADNVAVAQMMDRGTRITAYVSGLKKSWNPWKRVSVDVFWAL